MKPNIKIVGLIALLAVIVSGAAIPISVLGGTAAEANTKVIKFEVAENVTKFAFDKLPSMKMACPPTAIRSSPRAISTQKER